MNLGKINEVIKPSPAIHVQNKMTLLQRRAWNVLLANAYNELPNKDVHSISVSQLALKLGTQTNQTYLQDALKSLVDCTVEWNILGKDKESEWGVASLLAEARIKDGICFYQFPHTLKLRLHNPRVYAKLNLSLQNRFKSQHGLALWEICFDYFDRSRGEGETPFVPLEKFRELMGLNADKYSEFRELNKSVIKPAVKEINNQTDYFVEVEQKRASRRVAFLKFRIWQVKKVSAEQKQEVIPLEDIHELTDIALKLVQVNVARKVALDIVAKEWEFVHPDVLPEPDTYPDFAAYVDEKIEVSLYASNIKNRAGYIIEAIRSNYQDPELQKQRQSEKEKEQRALLDALKAERDEKVAVLLQQAVRENRQLLEAAAEKLPNFARRRLEDFDSIQEAYESDRGMLTGTLNGVLADDFCAELLAPVIQAYEDEKARLLGG